jgi:uncharacterized protein YecE (DUF72 family)
MSVELHIGASGWHYKHWRGKFYPTDVAASQMLDFYVRYFKTVEINNSFYRLPSPATFARWHDRTPADFRFAVKGSRYLTHMKKLKDPAPGIEKLLSHVKPLGKKLGPILFQLPPRWHVNPERLQEFLEALPKRGHYSFELRDPTWHKAEIYQLLHQYNAAFCIYELAGVQSPLEITADFVYVRLHGPAGAYQGNYGEKILSLWAARIRQWAKDSKDVWFYFDNDQSAFAVNNALRLKKMLSV